MRCASLLGLVGMGLLGCTQAQQGGDAANEVSEDKVEKKRDELRWFPADSEDDCKKEPGLEQVRRNIKFKKMI